MYGVAPAGVKLGAEVGRGRAAGGRRCLRPPRCVFEAAASEGGVGKWRCRRTCGGFLEAARMTTAELSLFQESKRRKNTAAVTNKQNGDNKAVEGA